MKTSPISSSEEFLRNGEKKNIKYSRKNDKKQIYSTVEYYSWELRSLFPIRLSQLPEKFSFVSSVILSIASNVSLNYRKWSKLKQR